MSSLLNDISVVVQGPIDSETYQCVDTYKQFKEIIFSTWNNENIELITPYITNNNKIILNQYPFNIKEYLNYGSCYYIAQTLLAGAYEAEGRYILKVRSDELYPNLNAMIDSLTIHPNKIHTTNNGFWKNIDFAMSSHIFIEQKKHIIKACELIIDYAKNPQKFNLKSTISESIFGYFFMIARDLKIDRYNYQKYFIENIEIISCDLLPDHLHSGGTSYHNGFKRAKEYPNRPDMIHNKNMLYNSTIEIIENNHEYSSTPNS